LLFIAGITILIIISVHEYKQIKEAKDKTSYTIFFAALELISILFGSSSILLVFGAIILGLVLIFYP